VIVVRNTFSAKYGKGDALVEITRELLSALKNDPRVSAPRILTDLSGPAFTVEMEFQVATLAVFETVFAELVRGPAFAQWFGRVQALVDHSTRQFFTVRL
jgi:hypothetical protein